MTDRDIDLRFAAELGKIRRVLCIFGCGSEIFGHRDHLIGIRRGPGKDREVLGVPVISHPQRDRRLDGPLQRERRGDRPVVRRQRADAVVIGEGEDYADAAFVTETFIIPIPCVAVAVDIKQGPAGGPFFKVPGIHGQLADRLLRDGIAAFGAGVRHRSVFYVLIERAVLRLRFAAATAGIGVRAVVVGNRCAPIVTERRNGLRLRLVAAGTGPLLLARRRAGRRGHVLPFAPVMAERRNGLRLRLAAAGTGPCLLARRRAGRRGRVLPIAPGVTERGDVHDIARQCGLRSFRVMEQSAAFGALIVGLRIARRRAGRRGCRHQNDLVLAIGVAQRRDLHLIRVQIERILRGMVPDRDVDCGFAGKRGDVRSEVLV